MLPVRVNGRVQQNGQQVIGHVRYIFSGQNFQVSFVPRIPKDTWLESNNFERKINAIT